MNRRWILIAVAVMFAIQGARAQQDSKASELLNKPEPLGAIDDTGKASSFRPSVKEAAPKNTAADVAQKAPTEITASQEASFDEKTRKAIFIGEVHVNDPQFNLVCDKLTAFLKKSTGPNGAKDAPAPNATPKPAVGPDDSGGLEKAIAEGHVVITQDKPNPDGGEPTHYIGRGSRVEYDAKTGDVTLTGWPQVQSGINNQVATDQSTVMILNRDGRMKTIGPSKTVIQEEQDRKKTPAKQ
jgi:lipopolysaccharide export system protein LptA